MHNRWPLAFGAALGLIALALGLSASPDHLLGWQLAARWTARVGFPLLLIAYSASSLGQLWPSPLTRQLWRDRRWWGLGFAASHSVHLFALITYLRLSGNSRPLPVLIGGGGAYVMLYLMAATSNQAAMRALGHNWRRLHTLGIHWLWGVFAFSYAGRIFKPDSMTTGLIGTALAFGALGLRLAAWRKRRVNRAPSARARSPAA